MHLASARKPVLILEKKEAIENEWMWKGPLVPRSEKEVSEVAIRRRKMWFEKVPSSAEDLKWKIAFQRLCC